MATKHSKPRLVSRRTLASGVPDAAPLRVALYLRKSTDDKDKDAELKSTGMQETNARKHAQKQGWTVLEDHIYRDDNYSGALVSRPAFDRLKAALGIEDGKRFHRAPDRSLLPFDILICRDQSRLIRNADHVTQQLGRILRTGVTICYYKTGAQVDATNFQPLLVGVEGHADSQQREKSRYDAREGLVEHAKLGHVCGGCCFGYDNEPVYGTLPSGTPKKSHTKLVVNKRQADTVRRIFRMFADGYGPRVIAKTANGDSRYRAESRKYFDGRRPDKPAVGKRGSGSWAPSAIRDMLRNERYIGVLVFGRMKNEYDEEGVPYRIKQPEADKVIRRENRDYEIVPPELWAAVQKRISSVGKTYVRNRDGTLPWGRPESGRHSKYLLSGLARCGLCGAALIAHKMSLGSNGKRKLVSHYVCSWNNKRGDTICTNNWRKRQDELDEEVLGMIEREVLTPERVQRALKKAEADAKDRVRKDPDAKRKLEANIKTLTREKDNLIAVQAHLADPKAVAEQINDRLGQIGRLKIELDNLPGEHDPRKLAETQARMIERIVKFRELMQDRRNTPLARQVLRKALKEPLKCIPILRVGRKGYAIARNSFILGREPVASPRGFEPRLPP